MDFGRFNASMATSGSLAVPPSNLDETVRLSDEEASEFVRGTRAELIDQMRKKAPASVHSDVSARYRNSGTSTRTVLLQ